MESAPKEDSSGTSRADKAEALMGVDGKKKGPSNALMFEEELQFWCGKVRGSRGKRVLGLRGFAKKKIPKIRDYYGSGSRSHSDFFLWKIVPK